MKHLAKISGVFLFAFLVIFQFHTASAATYIQGNVKFDDLAQTQDFYINKGNKVLSLTKQATKDASFEIQLTQSNGEVVDTCLGDAYTFRSKGDCYFEVPSRGKYYFTFISYDTTSTISMKYRFHD
ncbi:hypothetical protein SAMN05444392_11329 [Seinonella peptonophila]|uniref:Pre-peptidase C-terminal domain-containing protein n=1 Tax=Seinonella peptonophila TaxID=112248 RepID=A0A1M5ACB2_9BACL|nr:hypothetical protein [Seinonella peptonophila]SHF27940.1 hypothetical protein SAMN05444392_11329 [Seinonella peptonophila]